MSIVEDIDMAHIFRKWENYHTGMDCFGPFQLKFGRRYSKAYALSSMIAICGQVSTLLSDQGTNFKGASNELKKALEEMDDEMLKDFATHHMINFRFKPPSTLHAGGIGKQQIRTIRSILNTMLNRQTHPPDSTLMLVFLYIGNGYCE